MQDKKKKPEKKYKKRIIFFGMPDMALVCLHKLLLHGINIVAAVPPSPSDSTFKLAYQSYKNAGLNVITFENSMSEPGFLEKIKALDADLAVVASFSKKFPKELLELTKDGFVNLHPSMLPDYRGANPYSHVIINGEKKSAITLHFMDENFDTGDIISQYKFKLQPDETMGTLFTRTNDMCASMLYEALDYYETRPFPRRPQKKIKKMHTASALSFEKGNVFINWNLPARDIERFIRGLNPYIGAVTTHKGNILRINYAYVVRKHHNKQPGTVLDVKNSLKVACGKDILEIDSVQYAGLYISSGLEFAFREKLKKGDIIYLE